MAKIFRLAGLALLFGLAWIGAAFADHMTGKYTGTGDAVGTFIEIVQNGPVVNGTLTGADKGELKGRQTGQHSAAGTIDLVGIGSVDFRSELDGDTLNLTIFGSGGEVSFAFTRGEGVAQDDPTPVPADDDAPPPAAATSYYYIENGKQAGPVSAGEMAALIGAGTVERQTLVWEKGAPDWNTAESYPELAENMPPELPEVAQYYVVVDGEQIGPLDPQAIEQGVTVDKRFSADTLAWKEGMEAWAELSSFDEFAHVFAAPPPLPPITGDDDNKGPPPVPPSDDEVAPPPVPEDDMPPTPPEPPLDDAASIEALEQLFVEQAADDYSELSAEDQAALVACSMEALADITPEERQMLIDTKLEGTVDGRDAFEAAHPGTIQAVVACAKPADDAGDDVAVTDMPSSEMSLPDGRTLIVSGNGSVSISNNNGTLGVTIGDTDVAFGDGVLSINGEETEYPDFETSLTVTIADDGSVDIAADK